MPKTGPEAVGCVGDLRKLLRTEVLLVTSVNIRPLDTFCARHTD